MKFRYLLIAVLLFLVNHNILTQNKIAIGFNAMPALTYSYSPSDLPSPKSNFSYAFGLEGMYSIQPNLFIETGLSYQNKRLLFAKGIIDTRRAWIDVNGNGIMDNGDRLDFSLLVPTDLTYKYSSISIPITINYRTNEANTTSIIGSFGICLNYIYNIEELSKSSQFGENSIGNNSSSDFTSSLSIGLEIYQPITNNLFLILGPKYFYDFYSGQKGVKAKFQTFGLEIKMFYLL